MTQALPHVSLDSSRLVRFLTDLSVSETQVSHKQFSDRLGQLIDFSDSIALSQVHTQAPGAKSDDIGAFLESVTKEFLRARSAIVQAAMRSFFPVSGPSRIKWPASEAQPPKSAALAGEPYLKFYQAQQLDVDSKIRGLHLRTRDAVAALSPRLARIAALDGALGDALASHSRRYLNVVPQLLARRIEYLWSQYPDQFTWEDTREQLRREMQGLLLAEIEIRLLPALGLIEALNEETLDED